MDNPPPGRDDNRNSAVGSPRSMRPSSTSILSHPPRRSVGQGDSRGRVSHLRMRAPDEDDATLQSVVSQSGERSVLMPREGAGMTSSDFTHEGPNGRGTKSVTKESSRRIFPHSPQDKKTGSRLGLASPREADEDMFVSREVSGPNLPPTQSVASQGGEQSSMSPFGDKLTNHHLELASPREQGPEDNAGHRGAVPAATAEENHDGSSQHDTFQVKSQRNLPSPLVEGEQQEFMEEGGERLAQPGAYHVGIRTIHGVTEEDTIWGGVDGGNDDGAAREDDKDDDLLSAQLVDPEADRLQLHREVQMQVIQVHRELQKQVQREVQLEVHDRRAQQDSSDKACCIVAGVNFSKRTHQVFCLVVLALAVAVLVVTLLATDVVGPSLTSAAATSPSMSNPPIVSGLVPSAQPSRSPIVATIPSLQTPTKLSTLPPTPSAMANPTTVPTRTGTAVDPTLAPSPLPFLTLTDSPTRKPMPFPTMAPTPNATPFPSLMPVTPAPSSPVHVAQWVQIGNDIDGENPGDYSGISVALSLNGTVLAIGAYGNDGGGRDAGHVRVYFNTGGGWEQRGSDLDGLAAFDEFGWSVSLSANGNILAVGARLANGVNGVNSGQVSVFQWISNAWQELGSTLDGAGAEDNFGWSVALSDNGTDLAVGAFRNVIGDFPAGHVQIFEWTGTDWSQRGNIFLGLSPSGNFGNSVSLSSDGSIIAIGGDQNGPGYVKVYGWSGSAWVQQGSTLNGFFPQDHFGESICLSGDGSIVAVGAHRGNYAVVYQNEGSKWAQLGQTILGEASGDEFGYSVSLSSDGGTLLVGGYRNDSNGSNSGHALIFKLSPNEQMWIRFGEGLTGETVSDFFGFSTSISEDGARISIGAPSNRGNQESAGYVRVYELQ